MILRFPCATCERELDALAVESEYACPCGAEYEIRPMRVQGVPGLAILLGRSPASAAVAGPCPICGVEIGLGPIPPVALLLVPRQGFYLVDQRGQLCPSCGTQVPVEMDAAAAPRWREFAGERRR